MESFRGILKQELVHHRHYRTRREAVAEIREYIEIFYNRQRLQARLGYLSPIAYIQKYYQELIAAWDGLVYVVDILYQPIMSYSLA